MPEPMRTLRADAVAESWRLRDEHKRAGRRGPAPQPRLPVEPLEAVLRQRHRPISGETIIGFPGMVERHTRITRESAHRYIKGGGIPIDTADKIAIDLDLHPANIWPEWWEVPA